MSLLMIDNIAKLKVLIKRQRTVRGAKQVKRI